MGIKNNTFTQFARAVANFASAPTKANNEGTELTANLQGALFVDTSATPPGPPVPAYAQKLNFRSQALIVSQLVPAGGQCDILEFYGFKAGTGAVRYLHFFNAVALPANGTIPTISIALVGNNSTFSISYPPYPDPTAPLFTSAGFMVALSETPDILTLALSGTFWYNTTIGRY